MPSWGHPSGLTKTPKLRTLVTTALHSFANTHGRVVPRVGLRRLKTPIAADIAAEQADCQRTVKLTHLCIVPTSGGPVKGA